MDTERRKPLLAGRYRLLEQLGRGGMGVVWLALDEVLDREVAAKEVQAPERMSADDVRVLYARLKQEARAAARISHPNVITVHDVVEQEGRPWIVMELVRGQSLDAVLRQEGVLTPKETARIGGLVLQALRAAHAVGVLHRDVKPANVLLEAGGRVVLTDFGIALVEGAGTLTRTGDLIGSAEYLAPERAVGKRPGIPSDLWSLGALLYVAVEGVSPFRRGDALSTLRAVVDDPLAPPRRAGPLTPLLEGLLRKDPARRMGSAEAEQLLEAVASGRLTEQPGYVPTALDEQVRARTETPAPAPLPVRETPSPFPPTPTRSPTPTPTPAPAPAPTPTHSPTPWPSPVASPTPPPVPVGLQQGGLATPLIGPSYGDPRHPGYPLRPDPDPDPVPDPGRRKAAWIVAAVTALVLVAGGTAGVIAFRDAGGGGTGTTPGGGPTASVSQGTSGGQDGQSQAPATGPTGDDGSGDPSPSTGYEPSPSPRTTCGGGWVTSC
ncbi:serine/threonine-protein kinase [Streptomyces sp. UNOB3_S3]|uniref:serine/threonine-protein kinase n=1 Tax=Streptomyces sp. UNOB3_S3 TaxID=2871682 RepID=UPI001E2D609B|nr:serine/threonine-protein kinase [Streptomyces sp. UNOB3_S3]